MANGCWVTATPVTYAETLGELSSAIAAEHRRPVENVGMVDWDLFFEKRGVASELGVPALESLGARLKAFWLIVRPDGRVSIAAAGRRARSFAPSDTTGMAGYLSTQVGPDSKPQKAASSPIGFKTGWLLVRHADSLRVASALGSSNAKPQKFLQALKLAESRPDVVALTAIDGWTLGVGQSLLGDGTEASVRDLAERLRRLSGQFSEAFGFGTSRSVDYGHWIRCKSGKAERVFAFGEGSPMVATGRRSKAETGLKLGEDAVFQVAAGWAADVRELDLAASMAVAVTLNSQV